MEKNAKFNVLEAICDISKQAKESQLDTTALVGSKRTLAKLNKYFNTTDIETLIFIAIFSIKYNSSQEGEIQKISKFFDLDCLDFLRYKKDLQNLVDKKYVILSAVRVRNLKNIRIEMKSGGCYEINPLVEKSILDNVAIETEEPFDEDVTNEDFVRLVSEAIEKEDEKKGRAAYIEMMETITELEKKHKDLSLVQKSQVILKGSADRALFYSICNASLYQSKAISLKECLDGVYCTQLDRFKVANECKDETHPLFTNKLVQFANERGVFDLSVTLDKMGEELFLDEYTKLFQAERKKELITADSIAKKDLFFSEELEKQVSFLTNTLEEKQFENLKSRLKKESLPQGVCALFYGSPGTGKTETVYQIAKTTGRPIVHVDISQAKSMWFGQSEKQIKQIFQNYKKLCEDTSLAPILLFNEADAIFSKRKNVDSGNVAQTENAMQNIILEEMEKLDGILIATTNLTGNLDAAFERRFLFKTEFEQPSTEAKEKIWQSKMPKLSKKNATFLASQFDFSGGEIDNIVRKTIMDEVISGKKASLEDIETLCLQERIHKNNSGCSIGFSIA